MAKKKPAKKPAAKKEAKRSSPTKKGKKPAPKKSSPAKTPKTAGKAPRAAPNERGNGEATGEPEVSSVALRLAEERGKRSGGAAPHVVVKAYAGTGKTFSLMTGVAYAFGQPIWPQIVQRLGFDPQPSEEQRAIWNAFAESRNESPASIVYCAFNKSIVNDFGEKWGWLVEMLQTLGVSLSFSTVNSLGNKAVATQYGWLKVSDRFTDEYVARALSRDLRELQRNEPGLLKATSQLVGLCKLNLVGWNEQTGLDLASINNEELYALAAHYDIELNDGASRIFNLVPQVLRICLNVSANRAIDYNDQNWLPVVQQLPIPKSDLILVDEGQDLPRVRQEFVRQAGRRMILVGDMNQAIYGFAGADTDSIPRMESLLRETERGVEVLRLTQTRRCGKAIVEEARRIVPDFTAHESNGEGLVRSISEKQFESDVRDGDMVLSRVNAPLVSFALRLIKNGRKAVIRGRNFGMDLTKFIKKLGASTPVELIEKVDDWAESEARKESAKRNPSEARLIAINDRKECVYAFAETAFTIDEVLSRIDKLFAGKVCPKCGRSSEETWASCYNCKVDLVTPAGVQFSSVHRAKGLESDRVFILLRNAPMPHGMAKSQWQIGQEYNLKYVAITRAIKELVWVS